jgi:hypothetical protein
LPEPRPLNVAAANSYFDLFPTIAVFAAPHPRVKVDLTSSYEVQFTQFFLG